ncbi:MAG: Crp/Fnr family transcriptional regulator [Devosiaceae bacterium]|nr:Crp/Fnr family transcriptional regulator [Devosiaceae bacterium]
MENWTIKALGLEGLDDRSRKQLGTLTPVVLPQGHILFRPGDAVQGFVLALSGRIGVYLTGPNGRDLLLYSVVPGETCVQTTLGLLGEQHYTGEAIAETDISVVLVPKKMFSELVAHSSSFRKFVFRAFADRLQTVMHVLEKVAFVTIEARLAHLLLSRASDNKIHATHQELATIIGSSREVVSRRIELLVRAGIVAQDRGIVNILDKKALQKRAE